MDRVSQRESRFRLTSLGEITHQRVQRFQTGFRELDRVLGGGIIPGSVILIGGEPGIGKSTLMLQMADLLESKGHQVLYFSGEESLEQLHLRAVRCNINTEKLQVSNGTTVDFVISAVEKHRPKAIVCDSVQVMTSQETSGIAGSVAQIRDVSQRLIDVAKQHNIALFLVGHITKDGQIAGPKLLEHAVDTVLYFERACGEAVRLIRAHKNRFGPTFEVGIFEMQSNGLKEIIDASSLFIHHYQGTRMGSAFYPSLQGTRPLILEVQALTTPCQFGAPRRQGMGVDNSRVALLAAILEKSLGIRLSNQDIFVNIVGGVIERDPALDLAICLCLISSFKKRSVPKNVLVCGECGLGGEVRQVSSLERRLKEAVSLKLSPLLIPSIPNQDYPPQFKRHAKDIVPVRHIAQLLPYCHEPNPTP